MGEPDRKDSSAHACASQFAQLGSDGGEDEDGRSVRKYLGGKAMIP